MDIDTLCPCCRRLDEDGGHLFLKCKFARACWCAAILEEQRLKLVACSSAQEVMDCIFQFGDQLAMQAIQFARDAGMGRVIFETDATNLKDALCSNVYDLSQHGTIFRKSKYMLSTSFIEYKVVSCVRECNCVAHKLAGQGASMEPGAHVLWHGTVPDFVISDVASEYVVLGG
ncbi:hypothetical protein VPH35_118573 [Triticum aestivum]